MGTYGEQYDYTKKQLEKDLDKVKKQAEGRLAAGKAWLRERWWLGWTILGFFATCSVLWGVTR
jgi:hypothetical protein